MELLSYKGELYPKFQSEGNSAQFAIPFAKYFCKGVGFDIGCNRIEWSLPGSIPIDLSFNDEYHAMNLPHVVDYIFSSHCLEHLENWVDAMDYWYDMLNVNGILCLYLPDFSQIYWRSWNNRKHLHNFTPEIIKCYMEDRGYVNIFVSGIDLNNSFMIVGKKINL